MFISHTAQRQWKGGSGIFQGPWQALNPRPKGMNIVLTPLWCFNDLPTMLTFSFFFISGTQAFTVLKFGPLMTALGCFCASSTALCGAQKREPTQHCHMSLAVQGSALAADTATWVRYHRCTGHTCLEWPWMTTSSSGSPEDPRHPEWTALHQRHCWQRHTIAFEKTQSKI